MQNNNTTCWMNGQVIPAAQAVISVFDHGLLYGDGVFEGIRFYDTKAFRMVEHLKRLQDSASALNIEIPYSENALTKAVGDLIAATGNKEGYIRLLVTRGVGTLGVDPSSCHQPTVVMMASPLSLVSVEKRRQGLNVMIAGVRRMPVDVLDPRVKSLNYLNNVMAKMQANIAGMDEAIMLNAAGNVAEGTADNVFVVKNGTLYTPDVSSGALEGVTRNIVMTIARECGITVIEARLTPYDLYTADECFLTGTGVELLPVAAVDGRKMKTCPGEMFAMIEAGFRSVIQGETT